MITRSVRVAENQQKRSTKYYFNRKRMRFCARVANRMVKISRYRAYSGQLSEQNCSTVHEVKAERKKV